MTAPSSRVYVQAQRRNALRLRSAQGRTHHRPPPRRLRDRRSRRTRLLETSLLLGLATGVVLLMLSAWMTMAHLAR